MAELSAHAPLPRAKGFGRGGRTGRAGKPSRREAKGEAQQATEAGLDLLRVLGWLVLHDITLPGDLDVDHLLAGASGVYVVDTVAWSGPIKPSDHGLVVGGADRGDALAHLAAAADAVRGVLHGIPVAPMLCFERLEPVAGVAGAVALCASENILELLTSQPDILDQAAVAKASGMLALASRPSAKTPVDQPVRPSGTPGADTSHDASRSADAVDTAPPLAPVQTAPEDAPAAAVASAEDIARGAAFERLLDETVGASTTDHPADLAAPETYDGYAAIHDAGAALWRELTDAPDAGDVAHVVIAEPDDQVISDPEPVDVVPEDVVDVVDAVDVVDVVDVVDAVDVEAAMLEAELWEREVAEAIERATREERERADEEALRRAAADREGQEARDRKAREALERVEREALRLAAVEAEELAEREARLRAEAEELAEREAQERAEAEQRAEREAQERAEAEARELAAAAEARAQVEIEERARAEAAERAEVEAHLRAEAQARQQLEAHERVEAEARVRAEAQAHAEAEARELAAEAERERAEAEAWAQSMVAAREAAAQQAREQAEPDALDQQRADLETDDETEHEDLQSDGDVDPDDQPDDAEDGDEVRARADRVAAIREREAQRARERAEADAAAAASAAARSAARSAAQVAPRPSTSTRLERSRERRPEVPVAPPVAAPVAAIPEPARSSGHQVRALLQVMIGALVIAAVILGAPRIPDAVSGVRGLFGSSTTHVGTAVSVKATGTHPDVTVLAGSPVDAHATGGFRAAKGQHLVAVPLRLTNGGLVRWDLPIAATATAVDDRGITQPVAKAVPGLKGLALFAAQARIAPGEEATGYVVFSVPDGHQLQSVSLGLSRTGTDPVTWKVAP